MNFILDQNERKRKFNINNDGCEITEFDVFVCMMETR